jgi:hypothetical protein
MRTMAYRQWHRGSTYLSFLTLGRAGGGKYTLVVILLATTLSIIWAQFQLEEQYGDVQVNPAPERTAIDFGRIVDGYPLTDLSMCVRSGRVMIGGTSVALFTSLLGGQNLMATESSTQPRLWLWRHDWSDKGLQFGNPAERFSAFPWKYASTGTRFPRDTGLLTSLPRPLGCNR